MNAVKHPSPNSNLSVAIARVVLISTEAFGQIVTIYLFINLSKPISLAEDDHEEYSMTTGENIDEFYNYVSENITLVRF